MAGGKETPRQKMIGMMYLVLTALLALNVSKAVLDAFVAIEENIQKANIVQVDRGDGFYVDVRSELAMLSNDEDSKLKRQKLNYVLKQMDKIDEATGTMIEKIDNLKIKLLNESGENVGTVKEGDEENILWSKYDGKEKPCLPTRMHLMAVQAKDQYDIPMQIICGTAEGGDIKNIKGEGAKLWKDYNDFRSKIVELAGTYEWAGDKFTVAPKHINDFKDNQDLKKKVEDMIDKSKANLKEDRQVLIDLYMGLTKLEKSEVHGVEGVHWVGATFDHSPLVAALASLSSMQQEILSARALAMAHWKSKVSVGEYSFNTIKSLAYGPSIANKGDSVELQVMMAAFDSDNQPKVEITSSDMEASVKYPGNGQGLVSFKTGNGNNMTIEGTVSIKNKFGVTKTEKWSHDIIIMQPQGSIELPEMNILYRGYPNQVQATASGYDQTRLTGDGVDIRNSSDGYIVKPTTSGRTATLRVSGVNNVTGRTAVLKTVQYRVRNLPKPSMYAGTVESGETVSKPTLCSITRLFSRYPSSIPLKATFNVDKYRITVSGMNRSVEGSGPVLSSDAKSLLCQAQPGSTVTIEGKFVGMGYAGNMQTIIRVR